AIFNLIVLLIAIFWTTLNDTIMMGIFLGPVITTFSATVSYFQTNSRIGFVVLVITFFTSLWFINRRRSIFFNWATTKKK
ncbi:MAG: hypothetical protein AABY13_01065, partial [Nanoarchaeota archaeon]